MKTKAAAVAVLLATLAGGAAHAQAQTGIVGDWMTQGGEGKVRIAPCAGQPAQICGRLINPKTGAPAKSVFLTGFKPAGTNKWGGGKIANPQDGKTYSSKMALNPNGTLSVSGCVLGFCKAQTWTRAAS